MMIRSVAAASLAGAFLFGAAGVAAADDLGTIPPAILDTTCSLDQLMAATEAVNPLVYSDVINKYNSEPGWIQGGVVFHLNRLLQKSPPQRQAEIDTLAQFFPNYVPLFVMAEPVGEQIAAKCPTFPVVDPTVWNPAPPAA